MILTIDKALFIGASYDGQSKYLPAAKNDVVAIEEHMKREYNVRHSRTLSESEDGSSTKPTKRHILDHIDWLVRDADRSILFFYFAGHGGWLDEEYSSHILPTDHNSAGNINANTLRRRLVDSLPEGCTLVAMFQNCHSGNMLELPYTYANAKQLSNDTPRTHSSVDEPEAWVACYGSSSDRLSSRHDDYMSYMTAAFLDAWDSSSTYHDIYKAIERRDNSSKPEFSCSSVTIPGDPGNIRFLN